MVGIEDLMGTGGGQEMFVTIMLWAGIGLFFGVILLGLFYFVYWKGRHNIDVEVIKILRNAEGDGYTTIHKQDKAGIFVNKTGIPLLRLFKHRKIKLRDPTSKDLFKSGTKGAGKVYIADLGGSYRYVHPTLKIVTNPDVKKLEDFNVDYLIDDKNVDMSTAFAFEGAKPLIDPETLLGKLLMYSPFFLGFIIMVISIIFAGKG